MVPEQLDPRQPQRRAVGGHQQHRLRDRGQLHLRQPGRGHRLRDQLQREHPGQHVRPQRARQGPGERGFPTSAVYISESGSDKRVPGLLQPDLRDQRERLHRQLGRRDPVGERGPVRRVARPTPAPGRARWSTRPSVTAKTCNASTIRRTAVPGRLPVEDPERARARQRLLSRSEQDRQDLRVAQPAAGTTGCSPTGARSRPGRRTRRTPSRTRSRSTRATGSTTTPTRGPWNFIVHEQGNRVTWASWQGAPYGPGPDSVIKVQGSAEDDDRAS